MTILQGGYPLNPQKQKIKSKAKKYEVTKIKRAKKPIEQIKSKQIAVRLTAQEYKDFSEIAKLKNQSFAEFLRNRLYSTKVIVVENEKKLQMLHADNVRIGNYLIKHTHTMIDQLASNKIVDLETLIANKKVAEEELSEIKALLMDSKQLLLDIKKELADKRQ